MYLNRTNAPYTKTYPETRLANGGLIREAIVWGDNTTRLSEAQIVAYWLAKPRKTSLAAMLAKVVNESSFKPYICRYEIGQIKTNPNWPYKDEFRSTSYGLFQFMGFHLTGQYAVADKNNVFASFTIEKQFDLFDEFFYSLMQKAKSLYPLYTEDQLTRVAFAGYMGNFTPGQDSSVYTLAEKNYKTYLEKKKSLLA